MTSMLMHYAHNQEEGHYAEFGVPHAVWCKVEERSYGIRVWEYPTGKPFTVHFVASWREGVTLARRLVRVNAHH